MTSVAPAPPANGATAEEISYNLPEWMAISAFLAVAWYNVLQLNISIYMTFKRRRGLYFWSLLISGWGVVFHSLGFLLKLFQLTADDYISMTLITVGWWPMVTGQALVLYSRLHLVIKEKKILRGVLAMIIWNAITLYIPTTIFGFCSSSPDWPDFLPGFNIMERLQMTIFSLQEIVISSIYLWAAFRLLKPVYRRRTRSVMAQLIWINLIMVLMDASMLVMEYLNNYAVEATLKSMIYAIKLVLEFAVLNQLILIATTRSQHDLEAGAHTLSSGKDNEKARRPQARRSLSSRLFAKKHPFEADSPAETPKLRGLLSGSPASPFEDTIPSPFGRAGGLALVNTRSNESPHQNSRRPSTINDLSDRYERHGSVVSTLINNPAAFVSERRRLQDPFPIEPLSAAHSPHSEYIRAGNINSFAANSPRTVSPTRPAPTYTLTKHPEASWNVNESMESKSELPTETQEKRWSQLSTIITNTSSRNNYDPSVNSTSKEAEERDPELLRPRRSRVSDLADTLGDDSSGESEERPP